MLHELLASRAKLWVLCHGRLQHKAWSSRHLLKHLCHSYALSFGASVCFIFSSSRSLVMPALMGEENENCHTRYKKTDRKAAVAFYWMVVLDKAPCCLYKKRSVYQNEGLQLLVYVHVVREVHPWVIDLISNKSCFDISCVANRLIERKLGGD